MPHFCHVYNNFQNVVYLHVMEANGGREWCMAPLILNLGTRWKWVVNNTPRPLALRKRSSEAAGCVPQPVRMIDIWEKSLACVGIRTPHSPTRSPVTTPTAPPSVFLKQLLLKQMNNIKCYCWANRPRHAPSHALTQTLTLTPGTTPPDYSLTQGLPFFLLSRPIGTRHYDISFRVLRRSVSCGIITIYYKVCFFFHRARPTAGSCHASSWRLKIIFYNYKTYP